MFDSIKMANRNPLRCPKILLVLFGDFSPFLSLVGPITHILTNAFHGQTLITLKAVYTVILVAPRLIGTQVLGLLALRFRTP